MKELGRGVCNGVTFEFELFEPKSLVKRYIERDRAVKSSRKGAFVDGHFDNRRSIYIYIKTQGL